MGLNVKEEVLHFESLVGENSTQTVLQTTLDLSGSAPNIGRVVWVKGSAVISDWVISSDKVNIEGYIDLKLAYVAEEYDAGPPNYQVIAYRQAIAYSDYVEVIGAEAGMMAIPKINILGIEWNLQPDQRGVNVDVLVQLSAKVKQQTQRRVVTNASIQPPKKLSVDDNVYTIRSLLKQAVTSLVFSKELSLPGEDVEIKNILDCQVKPQLDEVVVNSSEIKAAGNIDIDLIYVNADGNVQACQLEKVYPYEVVIPNEAKINELHVEPQVMADYKAEVIGDAAFKIIGELNFKLDLYESKQVRMVSGLTGAGGCVVETRTEPIALDNLVNMKVQQGSAQGVIELDGHYPPIREVVGAVGKAANLDFRVDDDKVFVEGTISVELAYLAYTDDEHKPLYWVAFNNAVPFQQMIAIGGVQPGMVADLEVEVVSLETDLINRETIEVDVSYRSHLKVYEPVQRDVVVEAVEVPPVSEDPPTLTYVLVRDTDTLWKLSRLYHTSVESIVAANSWLREREQLEVTAGDKLCIPRRAV